MTDYEMESIDKESRYGEDDYYPHLLEIEDTAFLRRQSHLNDDYALWLQSLSDRPVSTDSKPEALSNGTE